MLIQDCIDFVTVRRRHFAAWASVVLFAARLLRYWISFVPRATFHRDPESHSLACSLYKEGKFADPFGALATGPSAHLAPIFPAFLALLMKVFGDGSTGVNAMKWAAVLILSLQLALYPTFSRILGMGEINGIIAASIWIVAKPMLIWDWEQFYAALFITAACCCYRLHLAEGPQGRHRMGWILGGIIGLLILTLPTVGLVYGTLIVWEMWHHQGGFFKRSLAPLVLLPVLIIAAWTVRNYLVFHRLLLVRDNLGIELAVSNNDCARFGMRVNFNTGCFDKFHPNVNVNQARMVKELGEVEYNDVQLRGALHWICSRPARFIRLSLQRFIAFWLPSETLNIHYAGSGRRLERVLIYLMTLLSVPGLVLLYRRSVPSAAIIASLLAVFPLIYYIAQFDFRYRYPIMWATFLLGALPIALCGRHLWEKWAALPGPPGGSK